MSIPDDFLERLPSLREVIAEHDLTAQKALGQNFIFDQNITDKIVRQAGDLSQTTVFEIGPGPGGLTRSILRAGAKKVIAIEFDPRAVKALQSLKEAASGRLEVVEGDALKVDLKSFTEGPCAIIANLPYNVATPLIVNWLRQIHSDQKAFQSMTLMVQKEVAQRITGRPDSKAYGRLSVLCQWLCTVRSTFDLSPSAFIPPPKVTSSVVHFVPRLHEGAAPDFEKLEQITAAAFGQRRKMIRSSMKAYVPQLEALGIDITLRAENLNVEDYIALAERI